MNRFCKTLGSRFEGGRLNGDCVPFPGTTALYSRSLVSRVLPHRISLGQTLGQPCEIDASTLLQGEKTGAQRVKVTCPLVGVQKLVSREDTQDFLGRSFSLHIMLKLRVQAALLGL